MSATYDQLLSDLLEASREGRVMWKESPRSSTFSVSLNVNSITIAQKIYTGQYEDHVDYLLAISDSSGKTLDSVLYEHDNPNYSNASELFSLALRKARRIDETLDEISKQIAEGGEIGNSGFNEDDIPF